MTNIIEPEHKRFSPSSLYRVALCPGSVQLIESLPVNEQQGGDSIYARRGTCAHAVGELCLEAYKIDPDTPTEPADFLNQEIEGVIVDDDIVFGATMYVREIKRKIETDGITWFAVENKLDLSPLRKKLHPLVVPEENGGTMDFIGYSPKLKRLYVDDYKNGKMPVEVFDKHEPDKLKALNMQAMDYALCAVAHYHRKFDIKEVEITIHQPNDDHPDGSPRSKVVPVGVVTKWYKKVLEPLIVLALSEDPPIIPGDKQCHYCPGSHKCKANYDNTCENAMVEFTESGVVEFPDPKLMTDEQIQQVLDNATVISEFLKNVKDYAHARAEQGVPTPGWKLVRKRTHRKLVDKPQKIRQNLSKLGLKASDYLKSPEMVSPAQLEKVMKSKGVNPDKIKKFLDDFVIQPEGGTNFVPESKPGKPVQPAIEAEFAELIETE